MEEQQSKKHKRKQNHETETEVVDLDDLKQCKVKKAKKKKKKSKHTEVETCASEEVKGNTANKVDMVNDKAMSKKRKYIDTEGGIEEVKSTKKMKRKYVDTNEDHHNDVNESTGRSEDFVEFNDTKSKKKKSKKKRFHIENDLPAEVNDIKPTEEKNQEVLEVTADNTLVVKQKKKHKKKKIAETAEEIVDETDVPPSSGVKKKKKKDKKKDRDLEIDEVETSLREHNVKEQIAVNQTNKDENNEIHLASVNKESSDVKTGQWSSVDLGDTERQNKFFKLLGGFKKGSDTSQLQNKFGFGKKSLFNAGNNNSKKIGGNFAMNKIQEGIYAKSLENEFDRAMGMNLNRGIGLGFEKPPDEGKKFYIDTKTSKSTKFDD